MRYLAYGALALVLAAFAVIGIGALLPVQHHSVRERIVGASPAAVFNLITDVARYPSWRSGVEHAEVLPSADGRLAFRETGRDGTIPYVVVSSEPDRRLVTQIAGRNLPFGGRWTFELTPIGGGTRLRITEDGEVYNPLYRFVSRFIIGQTAAIDRYLADVDKRLGRPATM
jgi:uncharacterized protein YndB with AHSA1/START domain